MTIWRMRNVRWKNKITQTHIQNVILIAFPLQQMSQGAPQHYGIHTYIAGQGISD